MDVQPFLHVLLAAVQAPTQAWSARDGQIRAEGAQGVYHGDVRVLAGAVLTVGGAEPETMQAAPSGRQEIHVAAAVRTIDGPGPDPTARLDRVRTARPEGVDEVLRLSCSTAEPVRGTVAVRLRTDAAGLEAIKRGMAAQAAVAPPVRLTGPTSATWTARSVEVSVDAPGARLTLGHDERELLLEWDVEARTGAPAEVAWYLRGHERAPVVTVPSSSDVEWSVPRIRATDARLPQLVERGLGDLAALRMSAAFAPGDVFVAAGAPWFFTLFGRDCLWAARMLLPLGTDLARGTLRTLAARQGTRTDVATAEQPGKILHELRRQDFAIGEGVTLPPLYYGTIDATPLWVCLLHDAWRWGMPDEQVEQLLPAMEAALGWMVHHGDADGDGFLEYVDESGHGLANQGWKDSGDSVQWRDGRLARGTIALAEVQGYAHEAAVGGAALLDAFGLPGADRWREYAAGLAERFRARFWAQDEDGPYPGIALDGEKNLVDSVTSNMGHLLGTGILDPQEEAAVARRLVQPDLCSGRGLRTMSTTSAGYWPLRYHGGAVWPHDTAIAVAGLARTGHDDAAAILADGLLTASVDLGWRLPELWSGDCLDDAPRTVPYPAACRPQAWSAASVVTVLVSALGLTPDVPGGRLRVHPAATTARPLDVEGLRLAGRPLDVSLRRDGSVDVVTDAPVTVEVVTGT
jgi:glycogen debranching enzyme